MELSGRPAPFFAANGYMPTSPRPPGTRPAACSARYIWAMVSSRAFTCSARFSMIALLMVLWLLRRLRSLRVLRAGRVRRRGGGDGVT
ncbi:hypothetical protein LXL04_021333 [Taraxacum kok-saghyz]